MEFEELPAEMQEEIRLLKHGSLTIEEDIKGALEGADTKASFMADAEERMRALISEADGVREMFGGGNSKQATFHLCDLTRDDIMTSAKRIGMDIIDDDIEEIAGLMETEIEEAVGGKWDGWLDEWVEFVVGNRLGNKKAKELDNEL